MACVKLYETEDNLIKAKEELRNTQEKLRNTHKKFEETKRKHEEKISSLENKLLHYLEEHTWKIRGLNEKLKQAITSKEKQIDSAPFYTGVYGRCGYKFKIRLTVQLEWLPKFISVDFVIMKGEHDSILPWPFRRKVVVTLVDQQEDLNDRENIVRSIIPDPTKAEKWNKRPVTDENTGKCFERPVSNYYLRRRRFIVDDTIFLQITVVP